MFEIYILPVLLFLGLGLIAGILLTVVSKLFEVKVDERLQKVIDTLPGINCGACGYSGCNAYAEAVLKGAATNECKAGGTKVASDISSIMGVSAGKVEIKKAFIRCNGNCNNTDEKYIFEGTQSCAAANRFYNGSEACTHGCLGFGDCMKVCPQNAIKIENRLAKVDRNLCVGCGLCIKACPDKLIDLIPEKNIVAVFCSSTDFGKITKSICKTGCIGCKICEKKCPNSAISVTDNLAKIDYSKCTSCGICIDSCPVHAIDKIGDTITVEE